MKHWLRNILILTLWLECKGEDRVTQPAGDVIAAEGDTVTLGCTFETSSTGPTLFWYKQDGNNSPKFMLSRFQRDEGNTEAEFEERFSSTLDSTSKSVPLKIQKLQLSDSAVYYCALRPDAGGLTKMTFGSGTRLTVEAKEEYKPSYYKLEGGATDACLATGFSRENATKLDTENKDLFNKTEAVRISEDSLFNQVALFNATTEGDKCPESTEEDSCEDTFRPGPTENTITVTIMILRLIFFKTIVFNVVMTLRLWISQ